MRLPSVSTLIAPGPRLRIFAALTIASAAAISFDSIRHLAVYAGFGVLSWLFPLTLDAVAAFGMDLWIRRSPAWKQARALALVSILGSTVANVADHYISQKTVLPAVLGAVPPAALAALLSVLHRHGAGTAALRTISGPVRVDPAVRDSVWNSLPQADRYRVGGPVMPVRTVVPIVDEFPAIVDHSVSVPAGTFGMVPPHPVRRDPVRKVRQSGPRPARSSGPADDVIVKEIRTVQAGHPDRAWMTKREVMAEYSVGSGRALKLISLAKEVGTDG